MNDQAKADTIILRKNNRVVYFVPTPENHDLNALWVEEQSDRIHSAWVNLSEDIAMYERRGYTKVTEPIPDVMKTFIESRLVQGPVFRQL